MKHIYLSIISLALLFSLSSCNEWLHVNPPGQVELDKLFEKESGFEDALNGAYIGMKDSIAYGSNLSMTTIEHLVSSWNVTSASAEEAIGLFDYGNSLVQGTFDQIFRKQYLVIAELNTILNAIDERKSVFITKGKYEQVKGECLAMRAYVHFDLLRLFGPVPGTETGELILPYATSVSKENIPYNTYAEYKILLDKDIQEAKKLLKIGEEAGVYADYKAIRMNLEAMNALDARAKLWHGDKAAAFELAKSIIETTATTLGSTVDIANGDYNLSKEHILGLHIYDMHQKFNYTFAKGTLYKGSTSTMVNSQLYGSTGTDIRETSALWSTVLGSSLETRYTIMKYKVESGTPSGGLSSDYRRIPLIRLSEMYLIAAETAPDAAAANTYWNTFRASRNLEEKPLPTDEVELKNEIMAEYRRELFAEGQAFYAYKRLNADAEKFLWLPNDAIINYVVPLPKTEVVQN